MSKAAASEDVAPRTMREMVQKKFLEEVIDAAGETQIVLFEFKVNFDFLSWLESLSYGQRCNESYIVCIDNV